MNLKKNHVIGIIMIVAVMVCAFSFLTFTVMKSNTSAHAQIDAYSFGDPHPQLSHGIYIYIDDTGGIERLLQEKFRVLLQETNIPGVPSNTLLAEYDNQVIALSIQERDELYTPFYTKSMYVVFFYYASSGKTTYFNQFRSGQSPVVTFTTSETGNDKIIIKGTLTLKDTSMGVMSLSGYHNHVAEYTVQKIFHELENHLYQ
jgi:hypothetical protein